MTSLTLLLWITAAILLQVGALLGVLFWRHWKRFAALGLVADVSQTHAQQNTDTGYKPNLPGWPGLRRFRVADKRFEDANGSVCSFYLAPEDGLSLPSFLSGQYLTFQLDIPQIEGRAAPTVRCYSLSDAPAADHYRISVKRELPPAGKGVPPGRSSNFLHDEVAVGDVLQVRAPAGHFHLDRSDAPVVLLAGGIGITPMLSMLNRSVSEQPGREVWLFYGVRNSREAVMLPHLLALAKAHPAFHLRICYSNPLPGDLECGPHRLHGRIDIAQLRLQLPLKPYHFYLCGPTSMLVSLVPALEDWGVPEAHIHFEAFGPASVPRRRASVASAVPSASPATAAVKVTFARSGRQVQWPGQGSNLLELALANGISLASGCRVGGCGTCQTTIRSGQVAYASPPDFDPEPGTCLMCVSTPSTDLTLEA